MDTNEALANLRAALERAIRFQTEDTDHDSFCVVPNRTVTEIVKMFGTLDGSLSSGGILPREWDRTVQVPSVDAEPMPATVTSRAANGHVMVYRVTGRDEDGSPRTSAWDARHSDDCTCSTDPEWVNDGIL